MGRPAYKPEPQIRSLVETLTSLGASQPAICRELARRGEPCRSLTTLAHVFAEELAAGRERRVISYALKLHQIAMSNGAGAYAACRYLLGVLGGPRWRVPKGLDEDRRAVQQEGPPTVHIVPPKDWPGR